MPRGPSETEEGAKRASRGPKSSKRVPKKRPRASQQGARRGRRLQEIHMTLKKNWKYQHDGDVG